MPQFSIIIPVYRVEEYLEKCVDSILAQTCQDFELLLIDDGSPTAAARSATAMRPRTRIRCAPCISQTAAQAQRATAASSWRRATICCSSTATTGSHRTCWRTFPPPSRPHRQTSICSARSSSGTARSRASCTRSFRPIFPRIRRTRPSCSSASMAPWNRCLSPDAVYRGRHPLCHEGLV